MSVTHKACLPFVRPKEPSFMPKDKYRFDVPAESLSDRYKNLGVDISERFGDDDPSELLPVKQVAMPDLTIVKKLPREAQFSVFLPRHRKYASELLKIFDACATIEDLIATALIVRDQVNPYMFAYAYGVTLSHRKDTQNIELPPLYEIFPAKFFKRDVLHYAREAVYVVPEKLRKPIEIPFEFTATNMDPEQRMAYFREDIGINSHHWHWHLVFPVFGPNATFYDRDRRGELFYYMHQQILCRYNTDRICNGLHVTEPLDNFRAPIPHGYYPKMRSSTSSRNIAPRQDNVTMQDLRQGSEFLAMTVNTLELHRSRILECIDEGSLIDGNGNVIDLNNNRAIDILGNLIEATALSVNPRFYGGLHNDGHTFIAFVHDPNGRHNEESGVMGDTTTAMRDPVFYRWHTMVNNLFELHKLTLPWYTDAELGFDHVKVDNVELVCGGKLVDELRTFWQKTDVNLRNGLDFAANEAVYVTFTHLNYEKFSYKISVTNSSAAPRMGTVRIFMCSVNDHAEQAYFIEGTRKNAIEMDRFTVNLSPGVNQIFRRSTESAITIPFHRIFPQMNVTKDGANLPSEVPRELQQACGCGWPEHMLLMKGTPEGFPCRLFVMISDFAQDTVGEANSGACIESVVFCGIRNRRYPDARPMGFPFDRPFNSQFGTLEEMMTDRNNMFNRHFTVRHINKVMKTLSIQNLNVKEAPAAPKPATGEPETPGPKTSP